jgi:hypothetical protein
MAYKDGKTFTTYCDKPYNRHKYKITIQNSDPVTVDSWDVARAIWFQHPNCVRIEVVD